MECSAKKMIQGIFINLKESTSRRKILEDHLQEVSLEKYYRRFDAIRGKKNIAESMGLKAGELGLWESWLKILEEVTENNINEYEYIHIIEDDVIISNELKTIFHGLKDGESKFDILFTDMHVNPLVHMATYEPCLKLKKNREIRIQKNLYTGCTSSVIIKKRMQTRF